MMMTVIPIVIRTLGIIPQKMLMGLEDLEIFYDMAPQTWIIDCPKMYKISDKIINFKKAM